MSDNNLFVFKKLRRLPTQDKAVEETQNWAEQVQVIPILNGKLLQFTFPAGATSFQVKHNMGRAFVSAMVAATDNNLLTFVAYKPSVVAAAGLDPMKVVLLGPVGGTPPGGPVALDVWVF